jgi:hypothetical protein
LLQVKNPLLYYIMSSGVIIGITSTLLKSASLVTNASAFSIIAGLRTIASANESLYFTFNLAHKSTASVVKSAQEIFHESNQFQDTSTSNVPIAILRARPPLHKLLNLISNTQSILVCFLSITPSCYNQLAAINTLLN